MSDTLTNKQILHQWKINSTWSLFLDRDGVINERKIGDYITMVDEFEFISGSLQAFNVASKIFGKIIVVTNQQGIGKGLMTVEQLNQIHDYMTSKVVECGGRIDGVYFSPHLAETNQNHCFCISDCCFYWVYKSIPFFYHFCKGHRSHQICTKFVPPKAPYFL